MRGAGRRAGRGAARAVGRRGPAARDRRQPGPGRLREQARTCGPGSRKCRGASRRKVPDAPLARRVRGHRPLRGHARRTRSAARARRDPAREQLPQVRDLVRRRARLHAGDAVLDEAHRHARAQPLPPAHEPALRLRDPAPLPRHRERRPLSRARALQRQPRAARVSERRAGDDEPELAVRAGDARRRSGALPSAVAAR